MMKKSLLSSLALAIAISLSTPVLADHKDYSKRNHAEHSKHFSGHHNSGKHYKSDRYRHDYQDRKHYKKAYSNGYKHGKRYDHQRHDYRRHDYYRPGYRYYGQSYRHDDNLYKWIAGTYIINELLHHHNGRTCYDRH